MTAFLNLLARYPLHLHWDFSLNKKILTIELADFLPAKKYFRTKFALNSIIPLSGKYLHLGFTFIFSLTP